MVAKLQEKNDGDISCDAKNEKRDPFEFESQRFKVDSDGPDMREHGNSYDDSCVDDGKKNISYLKLFMSIPGIAVQ